MGGFTSAPPILAAKHLGAQTFLHESNTIPGRANRWLSWVVDQAFVGFPQAGPRLHNRNVLVTGTPVRPQFQPSDPAACREKLFVVPPLGGPTEPPEGGTANAFPSHPVLLVMGGSQGASGINELMIKALPLLAKSAPQLRVIHLAGPKDSEKVRSACAALNLEAVVHPFFAEMELALGAATVAISRAGASSLAELAAMRLPSVLLPYPAATDNHQFFNARAFAETGAARLLEQKNATPESLASLVLELIASASARGQMQAALDKWHAPKAAEQIAGRIISAIARSADDLVPAGQSCAARGEDSPSSGDAGRQHFSAA
jgi:UDP-N-acetylglucosamine--N-acetylmuramyl-(pentapeptide) pyrophosphoryl-undecaprenol N-acetylglucosamine transferase